MSLPQKIVLAVLGVAVVAFIVVMAVWQNQRRAWEADHLRRLWTSTWPRVGRRAEHDADARQGGHC
jgi:cytochrome oxidase assembly protein ShyY1